MQLTNTKTQKYISDILQIYFLTNLNVTKLKRDEIR